jgi:Zn-dependent peptidase ImmA (M78 family)/transcriptional regulator with XRE-family HTH domain
MTNRLAQVRQHHNYSQERVARLLGMDRPKLSELEQGKRELDTETLAKAAQLFGVTTGYLLGLDGAKEPQSDTPAMRFRAALLEGISELEVSGFVTFLRRFQRLAKKYRYNAPVLDLPQLSLASDTRGFAIDGDAWKLRSFWGLGDAPIGLTLFSLLEDHGIGVYRQAVADSCLSGAYYQDEMLGHIIFVNANERPFRQVFTAAHELAHLIYHRGTQVPNRLGVSKSGDTSSEEWLCNRFASAFLMPATAIESRLALRDARREALTVDDVISLHRAFGVSFMAMLLRLKMLGILKPKQYDEFAQKVRPVSDAIQLGYVVYDWEYNYVPEVIPCESRAKWFPRGFIRLVHRAVKEGYLSDRKAAEFMNLEYEEWRDIARPAREEVATEASDKRYYEISLTKKTS